MATPDARICRCVKSVGFSFSLNGVFEYVPLLNAFISHLHVTIGHACSSHIHHHGEQETISTINIPPQRFVAIPLSAAMAERRSDPDVCRVPRSKRVGGTTRTG